MARTPFFDRHVSAGGRMIDFGGWELPVQYKAGILAEHRRVREQLGLFDVSHMGEVRVTGPGAHDAVRHLMSNDMDIVDGQCQYTLMCNHQGGVVDDMIVSRVAHDEFFICVNAANRAKDFDWMVAHNPLPQTARFTDESEQWAQIALQGRNAQAALQPLTPADLSALAYYHFVSTSVAGVQGCVVARTGYTGEDGFEVWLPPASAGPLWDAVVASGEGHGLLPIGLGARDTLRLEAAMCLYGNDLDDHTTPLEAGLGWAVKLQAGDFIGRDVLLAQRAAKPDRRLVGLEIEKRIARPHSAILHEGSVVGEVTSGTKSPTLEVPIALGYVPRQLARPGTALTVDVRGRQAAARVVRKPFYKRPY